MKAVVIGLGTQGYKRLRSLKKKKLFICSVDPVNNEADEKKISSLKKYNYDTVFLCVPDNIKKKYILFFLKKKKNVFVEKPLKLKNNELTNIEKLANFKKVIFYIAYNHRFEPHLVTVKKYIKKNTIGRIYNLKMYYGNGTAKLVNKSWRQKKLSIVDDLGSHLIDQLIFIFGKKKYQIHEKFKKKLENKNVDYSNIILTYNKFIANLEVSYCSWQNTFQFYLIGSKGSIKIDNLCKWGASTLQLQKRVLPSGVPKILSKTIVSSDPTWDKELTFFKNLIAKKKINNLDKDKFIKNFLDKI